MAKYSSTPKISKIKLENDNSYALVDKDARSVIAVQYATNAAYEERDYVWYQDDLYLIKESISAADNTSFEDLTIELTTLADALGSMSIVTDSTTNGNILVDGEEVQVYELPDNIIAYDNAAEAEEATDHYLSIKGGQITGSLDITKDLSVRGNLTNGYNKYILETDARLTDDRNPTAHAHDISDITELTAELAKRPADQTTLAGYGITDAKIENNKVILGNTELEPVVSFVAGAGLNGDTVTNGGTISVKYGTSSGTACAGDDARLSDARTPVAHNHVMADVTDLKAELDDIRAVAEGKTTSYVISTADNEQFSGAGGKADTINLTAALTTVEGETVALADLQIGDNIFIKEVSLPDRYVGLIHKTDDVVTSVDLYKLETTKVDLSPYATVASLSAYTKYTDFTWDAATQTLILKLPEQQSE